MRYAQQRTETRTLSLLIINLSRSLGDDEKYKKTSFLCSKKMYSSMVYFIMPYLSHININSKTAC